MSETRINAVLFDLDGTLIPSLKYWLRSYQTALREHGHELSEEEVAKRCCYRPYSDLVEEFSLPCLKSFVAAISAQLEFEYKSSVLNAGVRELLDECSRLNLKIALVTSSGRADAEPAVRRLGLPDSFHHLVYGCDVQNLKPHPEPILAALKRLAVAPREAIMVGDYLVDIQAGKAAGTRTALYLPEDHRPYYDFEELRGTEPDFVFSRFGQLQDYIRSLLDGDTAETIFTSA